MCSAVELPNVSSAGLKQNCCTRQGFFWCRWERWSHTKHATTVTQCCHIKHNAARPPQPARGQEKGMGRREHHQTVGQPLAMVSSCVGWMGGWVEGSNLSIQNEHLVTRHTVQCVPLTCSGRPYLGQGIHRPSSRPTCIVHTAIQLDATHVRAKARRHLRVARRVCTCVWQTAKASTRRLESLEYQNQFSPCMRLGSALELPLLSRRLSHSGGAAVTFTREPARYLSRGKWFKAPEGSRSTACKVSSNSRPLITELLVLGFGQPASSDTTLPQTGCWDRVPHSPANTPSLNLLGHDAGGVGDADVRRATGGG
jgi:hypothetical protein